MARAQGCLQENLERSCHWSGKLEGLLTLLTAVPLLAMVSLAICTPKMPILMKSGFWKMAHGA